MKWMIEEKKKENIIINTNIINGFFLFCFLFFWYSNCLWKWIRGLNALHPWNLEGQEDSLNGPDHAQKRMGNVGSPTSQYDKSLWTSKATFGVLVNFLLPTQSFFSFLLDSLLTNSLLISWSMHEQRRKKVDSKGRVPKN